jgi:hypothetical protein
MDEKKSRARLPCSSHVVVLILDLLFYRLIETAANFRAQGLTFLPRLGPHAGAGLAAGVSINAVTYN